MRGIKIYGDVKTWAEKMWKTGRTSGTCSFVYVTNTDGKTNLSWGGQPIHIVAGYNPTITFSVDGVSIA